MKNKPLFFGGIGAGIIALVAFIAGFAFVWPGGGDGQKCSISKDGQCSRISGGIESMMGKDSGCGVTGSNMDNMMSGAGDMMNGTMRGGAGDMMNGTMRGGAGGMMNSMMGSPVDAASAPITIDQAADVAKRYVSDQGNNDLKVTTILEFTNGFYARVKEISTGTGAYELKVDRNTGDVSRTIGADMIWNRKYRSGMEGVGHGNNSTNSNAGGMMDNTSVDNKATTAEMTIKSEDARGLAQKYADVQFPGSRAGNPEMFYGYYIIGLAKDDHVIAILSVNGYSGQVWLNVWNGTYLGGKAL